MLLAYALDSFFRKTRFYRLFLYFINLLPLLSIPSSSILVYFLVQSSFLRLSSNVLFNVYEPAYRYFAFAAYFCTILLTFCILRSNPSNKNSICNNIQSFGNLALPKASFLVTWFSFSLFFYWSFLGIGTSARILSHVAWISCYLLSYFIVHSLVTSNRSMLPK